MFEPRANWDIDQDADARTLFANHGAAPGDMLALLPTTDLFGLKLIRGELGPVAQEIVTMARIGEAATIQFINAHCVNTLINDADYRAALEAADHLLPDGSGLAIAAKLAGMEMGANLNGTDLFPEICDHAARQGASIYLLGGQPGIASMAARAMRQRYRGVPIVGTRHGFWTAQEEQGVIDEINASGARIVMVGMGVPRQEKWIAANRHRLRAPIVMGVGGLFDYYSGAIPRAPLVFRKAGCEWTWRLMQEPRRLFLRYVVGNPVFLASAVAHALAVREAAARWSLVMKWWFDRAVAGLALALLSPLFAMIALAIWAQDRGPVFFRQTRIGAYGKPFRMWKFRSMVVDAEARLAAIRAQSERGGNFKMKDDPRITSVGRFLRRTSLDELPQLINVLRGQMSIVGPRPSLPGEVVGHQGAMLERLKGLPGITCTWQVSGRANVSFEQQVALDVDYLKERSLWGDLLLICRTIPAVIMARGAY